MARPFTTPPKIGRYTVQKEIGRGGMGRVFAAKDPELRRDVAVKMAIEPDDGVRDLVSGPSRLARFVAEAQITSQLEHPNIVPVHDIGVAGEGRNFFVMRLVDGLPLRSVLNGLHDDLPGIRDYWTPRRLLNAFVQAGQAVAFAHERGVIHRDLKPDNIMLGPYGEVLVMDWGLACLVGDCGKVSVTNGGGPDRAVVGTPGYMSPEQANGDPNTLDARTDVWSLGAILYEILSWRQAYTGADHASILRMSAEARPADPRLIAPDRTISPALSAICLRAMEGDRALRYPSAKALVDAVESWLEGSARRAQAAQKLREGEGFWDEFQELLRARRALEQHDRLAAEGIKPWSVGPEKEALIELRDQRDQLAVESALTFARVVAMGERALSLDPGNAEARAYLARAYWSRFEESEAANNIGEAAFFADRVREYDDGGLADRLRGDGLLTLLSNPPGALVFCRRVNQRGLAWTLGEPRILGPTPIVRLRLEMGGYILTLRYPGRRDATYPIYIQRSHHWDASRCPVLLLEGPASGAAARGPASEMQHVPGGPFQVGGDPEASRQFPAAEVHVDSFLIGRFPVRAREYCAFLNALQRLSPDEARLRVPRRDRGLASLGEPYWPTPAPGGVWQVPSQDVDGDPWNEDWPIFSVSWHDARAYAAWRSAEDGVVYDLPTEHEWEKAARGTDRRFFPWGNRFDPTACKMEQSRPGRPQPEVVGAFPLDTSPYGVRDLAGGVREWCAEDRYENDVRRRPVRGGCWAGSERLSRVASRYGFEADVVHGYIGFRLVRRLPDGPAVPPTPEIP